MESQKRKKTSFVDTDVQLLVDLVKTKGDKLSCYVIYFLTEQWLVQFGHESFEAGPGSFAC